ncbi:hypothetical protein BD310DRAFT_1010867 [Dichomitus squalens]|uniref:F-box domain-containing protein n=1 Tax=Dichomitus squalens TaxID=114155 RepID=A0A4Q9PY82_9APHY|nr:hypothetical protein BD310DRAFT_1010867 [Dichomitus squalens]
MATSATHDDSAGGLKSAFASIHALPTELLSQVFEYAQECTRDDHTTATPRPAHVWLTARLVCKTWRQAMDNHHRLWATIDVYGSRHSLDWVRLCLANSGSVDLDVRFHAPERMPPACGALFLHTGRIRSIAVYQEDTVAALGDLQGLFDRTLPKLTQLILISEWHSDAYPRFVLTELLDIRPDRVPALRALHMNGVFLPWTSALLPNLRVLTCHGWSLDHNTMDDALDVALPRFLAILSACQSLEHLSINVNSAKPHILNANDSRLDGPIPTAALPNLRTFDLTCCVDDADILFDVLSHVRFSERCAIALRCGTHCREAGRVGEMFPNDPDNYPILRTAVDATWHGPAGFSCKAPGTGGGSGGELVVDVDCDTCWARRHRADPYPVLAEFCAYLERAPLTTLAIEWPVKQGAYADVFRTFPALEHLTVDFGRDSALKKIRKLLRALKEGATSSSSEGVVLPDLRTLRLDKVGPLEEVPQAPQDSHGSQAPQVGRCEKIQHILSECLLARMERGARGLASERCWRQGLKLDTVNGHFGIVVSGYRYRPVRATTRAQVDALLSAHHEGAPGDGIDV